MKKIIILVILITLSLLLNAQNSTSSTRSNNVPNLISFQGRLSDDNGDAVNATVNIIFSLYDDEIAGSTLWSESQSVDVEEGLFNVVLGEITDLDEDDFNSADRWIGITVGTDSEMTPRTRITAVPYALQAGTSTPDNDWTISGSDVYNETSNVGIGTTNPTNRLHIEGSEYDPLVYINKTGPGRGLKVRTTSACALWVENSGNHGLRVSSANGDGVHVENAYNDGLHVINAYGDGIEVESAGGFAGNFNGDGYFSGNLGLGTFTPARTLHVNDYMRLEPVSNAPDTPSAGDIYFDLDDNMLKCYDGSTWRDCWETTE